MGIPVTEERKELFLEMLAEVHTPVQAAKLASVPRAVMYKLRKSDELFAARWADAQTQAVETLVAEARRRAYEGVSVPKLYRGKVVTVLKEHSDDLLKFLLTAWDRKTYGVKEKHEHTGAEGAPLMPEQVGDIEIARRVAWLLTQTSQKTPGDDAKIINQNSGEEISA